ncbi:MAG: OmpA family protein [Phycisphaerales bacterium]
MKKIILSVLFLFPAICTYAQGITEIDSAAIFFASDKFELTAGQKEQLNQKLKDCNYNSIDSSYFRVEAYTDEKGSVAYNKVLSEKRARAIRNELYKIRAKWSEGHSIGNGIDTLEQNDSLQRHAKIKFFRFLKCGNKDKPAVDTLDLYDPEWFTNIRRAFTSEEMIKQEMYAIDIDENILKTAGMISFELTDAAKRKAGFYNDVVSVCIPVKDGEEFDPKMTLWASVRNDKGEIRWVSIVGDIKYKKESNCYKCYFQCADLPSGSDGKFRLNIDRRPTELVYFSVYKDYGFKDVRLTRGSFSGIEEVQGMVTYIFVREDPFADEDNFFAGDFERKGEKHTLKVQLSKCKIASYKESRHYILQKKTNYFIDKKQYNKRGIIAWIVRIFEKGDDY